VATLSSWFLAGRSLLPAQQAWERQRLFVANASHELRTPLSIIQLSTEVSVRGDTSEEERRELAGDILRETQYMTRLVADLLLLSRLDVGQLKLELSALSVPDLLVEAQHDVARLADEHGVNLIVEDSEGIVNTDRMRLRQVLLIILDNALRHTSAGGEVILKAATHGRSATITVSDTGRGIAPEHLSRIFDRFYQADEAHSKKGSAGLGLSIAKSLVEAMRGHISISSEVGKGTLVTIQLPAA
jgi:signal transduction histidine kinase